MSLSTAQSFVGKDGVLLEIIFLGLFAVLVVFGPTIFGEIEIPDVSECVEQEAGAPNSECIQNEELVVVSQQVPKNTMSADIK